MTWGTFSPAHLISLAAAGAIIVCLYFLLRPCSRKIQTVVLGILSFSGIAAIIYNLVSWGSPLEYLPLELCSLNAMLLPVAVFSKNKTLANLLLLWSLGALIALVMNNAMTEAVLFGWPFNFYYFPHVLEFGIPILLFALGHTKKDAKCIFSTIGITFACYTAVYFANVYINAHTDVTVNYMFCVDPSGNPLTVIFHKLIPYPYWYMYGALPILVVYLGLVYRKQLLALVKRGVTA